MNGLSQATKHPPLPRRRDFHVSPLPRPRASGAPGLLLCFRSAELESEDLNLCTLAGVEPERQDPDAPDWPDASELPHLITDELGMIPASVNRSQVTVIGDSLGLRGSDGQSADYFLPDHQSEVIELLAQLGQEPVANARATLVVAWHGGGGATAVATRIASLTDTVLLDAAGNFAYWPPGSPGQIGWGHLDAEDLPSEPQLRSALRSTGGVTRLTNTKGLPVSADDPTVAAVTGVLGGVVVIECGSAFGQAANLDQILRSQGIGTHLLLVGQSSVPQQSRLARALAELMIIRADYWQEGENSDEASNGFSDPAMELTDVSVLLRGRPNDVFRAVMSRFPVRWWRQPSLASTRRWERLLEKIEGASQ